MSRDGRLHTAPRAPSVGRRTISGSTIGGVVGGVIGFYFGNPQLGFAIGSAIGGALDPQTLQGPRLGDIPVQTAQEGAPRPIVYGSPQPFPGNIILTGPKIRSIVEEEQDKGGPVIESEAVHQTYAIRICEGIATVITVWRDGKVVFDRSGQFGLDPESAGFASKATFYTGDETQLPDPTLEGLPTENGGGAGNVNAYRGTAYMVVAHDDLTPTGGRIPTYEFRMASSATVSTVYGEPMFIAGTKETLSTHGQTGFSPNGTSWSDPPNTTFASFYIYGNGTLLKFLGQDSYASTDRGATFGSAVAMSGTPWSRPYYDGTQFLAPVSTGGVDHSLAGASWGNATGTSTGGETAIGGNSSLTVVGSNTGHASFAAAGSTTFSTPSVQVSAPGFPGGPEITAISDGGPVVVLGDGDGNLWWTVDGITYTACTGSPFTNNVLRIHYCEAAGVYVACGQDGNTGFSANGKAWQASTTTGLNGVDIDSVGSTIVMVCNLGAGIRKIQTTGDGDVWVERSHQFTIDPFVAIAAMPCEGIEAPDAPGFFVNYDGSFCGGTTELATLGSVYLSEIELDIAARCGIDASQFDVSADTDVEVQGYLIGRQMQGRAALQPLGTAYFRDYPEYDLQIHSIPRGGAIVDTLTDDDFVDSEEDEQSRRQMIELPRKLNLFFSDPSANYARVPVPAERESINVPSTGVVGIELPLVLDRDVAAQKADILFKVMTEEAQGTLVRKLPAYAHAEKVVSDCISYDDKRWRLDKVETVDGVMSFEAKRDRTSNYVSAATANGVLDPSAPVSSMKGPTVLRVLNLPSLRTSDNEPGVYVAVTGLLEGWPGAHLYLSVDGGESEQFVMAVSKRATIGRVLSVTEDSNGDFDPLVVEIFDNRELQSITSEQLLARQNAFAIVTNDVAEIGQFQTATEDSSGFWELTDTSRGLLNTAEGTHGEGSDFVLLDGAIYFVPIDVQHAGKTLIFRAVTRGTASARNTPVSIVFDPPTFIRDGGVVTP